MEKILTYEEVEQSSIYTHEYQDVTLIYCNKKVTKSSGKKHFKLTTSERRRPVIKHDSYKQELRRKH